MGAMNIWMLRWGGYREPDPADPTPFFAVVARDYTPLPAYEVLRRYQSQSDIAGPGAHVWSHPAVEQIEPDMWAVRFRGQSLHLVLRAPVTVALAGEEPVEVLPPMERNAPVGALTGLRNSEHTVIIRGAQPPEAFVVAREQPLAWLWVIVPAVLVAALAVVCGLAFKALGR